MGRSMSSRHVVLTSEQEDLKAMLRNLELKDKANKLYNAHLIKEV